jgi:site-specific recombinase XerD
MGAKMHDAMNIYRRHLLSCKHFGARSAKTTKCLCPFWVDYRPSIGPRYQRSLGTTNLKIALRRADALESGDTPLTKAISDAVAGWDQEQVNKRIATETMRRYRRILNNFSNWCKAEGYGTLQQCTVQVVDEFRSSRSKIAAITSAKELETIRAFFRFCIDRGWLRDNPAAKIKAPKIRLPENVPYTPQEVALILSACNQIGQEPYERLRVRAMVLLMRYTGLRIGDAARLRLDQVRDGEIFLHAKKNGQAIIVPIPSELILALEALPSPIGSPADGSSHYFWNGTSNPQTVVTDLQRVLKAVYNRSEVRKAHNHRFRHTLASEILAVGKDTDHVADVLGISSHIAKKHYIKFTVGRQQKIRETMEEVNQLRAKQSKIVTKWLHENRTARVN